jgi:hypothetical protein
VRRGSSSKEFVPKERWGGLRSEGYMGVVGCAGVFSAKRTAGTVCIEGIWSPKRFLKYFLEKHLLSPHVPSNSKPSWHYSHME